MSQNKIIKKQIWPYRTLIYAYIIAGVFAVIGITTNYKMSNKIEKQTESAAPKVIVFSVAAIVSLVGFVVIYLFINGILKNRKETEKMLSQTTYSYIKKSLNKHPELKKYQHVLYDSEAIKSIYDTISNALAKPEQKQISKILFGLDVSDLNDPQELDKIDKAREDIVNIIREYANTHDDFILKLKIAMINADYEISKRKIRKSQEENTITNVYLS